jgi:hypothetical protein
MANGIIFRGWSCRSVKLTSSSPSSVMVKNKWSYTSARPLRLHGFDLRTPCLLYMKVNITFIANKRYTNSSTNAWMHCDGQKKIRSTKQKMEGPTLMKTGQAWIGLRVSWWRLKYKEGELSTKPLLSWKSVSQNPDFPGNPYRSVPLYPSEVHPPLHTGS